MLCECAIFFLNILKAQCESGAPVAPQASVYQIFSPIVSKREKEAAIFIEIQEFGGAFGSCVELCLYRREANEAAQRCAKQASSTRRRCLMIDFIPAFLIDVLQYDCNPS